MAGVILGCAANRVPVVLDGFISYAAALIAYNINPRTREYMIASHLSAEPGAKKALSMMELEPFLDMDMRLGEGSGAALDMRLGEGSGCPIAFSVIEFSCAMMNNMATFDEIDMGR